MNSVNSIPVPNNIEEQLVAFYKRVNPGHEATVYFTIIILYEGERHFNKIQRKRR